MGWTCWFGTAASLPVILLLAAHFYVQYFTLQPDTDFGTGSMFDTIANRYDFVNRALALNMDLSWRQVMVDSLVEHVLRNNNNNNHKHQVIRALDLATGTADVALILADTFAKRTKSRVEITGMDPSANMLAVGKTKVAKRSYNDTTKEVSIKLHVGDSRDLRSHFDANTFDVVTMSFGIRNVPAKDRPKALCEMHHVLKVEPSSQLAILEFSEPEGTTFLEQFAKFFIRHVVPSLGALLSGAPKEYLHLQNSIDHFPTAEEFVKIIEGVKCPVGESIHDYTQTPQIGTFKVESVRQLNFGSVQIYLATPILVQS